MAIERYDDQRGIQRQGDALSIYAPPSHHSRDRGERRMAKRTERLAQKQIVQGLLSARGAEIITNMAVHSHQQFIHGVGAIRDQILEAQIALEPIDAQRADLHGNAMMTALGNQLYDNFNEGAGRVRRTAAEDPYSEDDEIHPVRKVLRGKW